ncbi:MAG: DUF4232 domain-containing protein [Streptosporangiaceae bacterium]|nr:DUF4232 domain-containing protein [Streptosporangiaceae bacterium]
MAGCRASDLQISVPAAIPGDPAEEMGKQAWNLVFRDNSRAACSLRGWPHVQVRTASGKTVPTSIGDASFSNLAVVPDEQVVLRPGQSAVVTAMSPAAAPGCVTRWTLALTLPGAASAVSVTEPAGPFVPCVGGRLLLSPFYAEQTLTSEVRGLRVSAAPTPFPATTAAEPPVCTAAALRAQITSAASGAGGTAVGLRISNAGSPCVLRGSWPTVWVGEAGGAGQVAKVFPDPAALQAERALLTTYERGTAQDTALTLRHDQAVSIALLAAGTRTRACRRLASLTVYPSAAGGAGRTARTAVPVSICGSPRILSYLPGDPADSAMGIARGALDAIRADPAVTAQGSDTGFYYGTDSAAPTACGTGPYTEPAGDCANGTEGTYGEYMGMVGSFANWQGCTTSGLAWDQSNYNMANDNLVDYHTGLGAAGYWFAAGPGRDPHYNGTASEATAWGEEQAAAFLSAASGLYFNFRYVFIDIENNGTAPDGNGWNTVWNGPCGGTAEAEYIDPSVDYATYLGFTSYIDAHSPYLAGVYSAGGPWYGAWAGIFGGEPVGNTAEWTFTNEQSELDFPSGFTGSAASPYWFGGAPAACDLMWQWSGGDGVINGYGDFDQAYAAYDANASC